MLVGISVQDHEVPEGTCSLESVLFFVCFRVAKTCSWVSLPHVSDICWTNCCCLFSAAVVVHSACSRASVGGVGGGAGGAWRGIAEEVGRTVHHPVPGVLETVSSYMFTVEKYDTHMSLIRYSNTVWFGNRCAAEKQVVWIDTWCVENQWRHRALIHVDYLSGGTLVRLSATHSLTFCTRRVRCFTLADGLKFLAEK